MPAPCAPLVECVYHSYRIAPDVQRRYALLVSKSPTGMLLVSQHPPLPASPCESIPAGAVQDFTMTWRRCAATASRRSTQTRWYCTRILGGRWRQPPDMYTSVRCPRHGKQPRTRSRPRAIRVLLVAQVFPSDQGRAMKRRRCTTATPGRADHREVKRGSDVAVCDNFYDVNFCLGACYGSRRDLCAAAFGVGFYAPCTPKTNAVIRGESMSLVACA